MFVVICGSLLLCAVLFHVVVYCVSLFVVRCCLLVVVC